MSQRQKRDEREIRRIHRRRKEIYRKKENIDFRKQTWRIVAVNDINLFSAFTLSVLFSKIKV
jgi:hypothetical protein